MQTCDILPSAKRLTSRCLYVTISAFTVMKRRSKRAFPAKRAFVWWKKEREAAQIHRGAGARTKILPVGAPRERPLSRGSVSALCEAAFVKRRRTRGGTASHARPLSERTEGVFVTRKRLGMSENQIKMNIGGTDKWVFTKSCKRAGCLRRSRTRKRSAKWSTRARPSSTLALTARPTA